MSMHKIALLTLTLSGLTAGAAIAAESPKLGQPITEKDAAAWNQSIGPDGVGLPPGRGTVTRGAEVYAAKCEICHAAKGAGTPAYRLVGGQGSLDSAQPIKTVGSYWPYATTLFDYVRRAMPLNEPQSLSAEEVYAVSAYVLNLNGVVNEKFIADAKSMPQVKMPNRDNFFVVYPGNLP